MNLYADFIDLINAEVDVLRTQKFKIKSFEQWRSGLTNIAGTDLSEFSEDELREKYRIEMVFVYFDWSARFIEPRPREIRYATDFDCPEECQPGLDNLVDKIKYGKNISSHLSRGVMDLNDRDGMLFDWGITHLHLGIKQDRKKPLLVEGGSYIVYAYFNKEAAYLLKVAKHGHWADIGLLETLSCDFPHLIELYEMKNIQPPSDKHIWKGKDLMRARKAGITSLIKLNEKMYMPPGGGFVMSGGAMNSTTSFNRECYRLKALEEDIRKNMPKLFEQYDCTRNFGLDDISLTMTKYSKKELLLTEERYDFSVKLSSHPDDSGMMDLRLL